MYKILFVSALNAELKIVKQEIKKLNISNDIEISFFESGMWNYKTILNLGLYLAEHKYNFIINIGVCWWSNNIKTGHPQGMPLQNNYGCPEKLIQISGINNISNNKELISPVFLEFTKVQSIACSEKIIYNSDEIWENNFVDMESYWFEMVCNKFDIPRIILKIPVDKIWKETKKFDFEKAKKYLRENINYSELLEKIEKYLEKNSTTLSSFSEKEIIIKNKILNNYKWTFSEKIILEKEMNKFIVLELWNIEDFFDKNKQLNKKEFLKKLQNIN